MSAVQEKRKPEPATILVVDDDQDVLLAARMFLRRHFKTVLCSDDPSQIPALLIEHDVDIVLLDMNFDIGINTGDAGLNWLARIQAIDETLVVVLMTAFGGVELAVDAMKSGATDFVLKPWQNEKLLATLSAALRIRNAERSERQLQQRMRSLQPIAKDQDFIVESQTMVALLQRAAKAAQTDANVLILGENGTGKDQLARFIHANSSRAHVPMLSIDLGAVSESLFDSELFGHIKGAFTDARADRSGLFAAADGATIFLDEIGNLSLSLQAKLLRVIESGEYSPVGSDRIYKTDTRIICATNAELETLVANGTFRQDLYYRLNTLQFNVPALRERKDDIQALFDFFNDRFSRKYACAKRSAHQVLMQALCHYPWPGNIRELSHAVERAVILADGHEFKNQDFDFLFASQKHNDNASYAANNFHLEAVERQAIEQALERCEGNVSHAAKQLGITRASLYRRLKKHQL